MPRCYDEIMGLKALVENKKPDRRNQPPSQSDGQYFVEIPICLGHKFKPTQRND